ncbi:MAG: biotin-dependent carboxyltransferase family protein, partial [Candidatus Rokuibacteriota bacterium]
MPDNPWAADLDRLRSDLEQKIEGSAAETRRHFDVVVEHVMSSLQLVAEGVAMVDQKMDRFRSEMEQRFEQVDRRLLRLSWRAPSARAVMSELVVQDAGPLTTIQDLGRPGHLRVGIPASGPMDREAFVLANRLVGNSDTAAGLECTLIGPRLAFTDERLVAVTGADMAATVNGSAVPAWQGLRVQAGDVLRLGPARSGVRGYVAIAGGLETPLVLGSRAT